MSNTDMRRDRVIHQVIRQKADQFGNREFLRFGDRTFGYMDIDRESDRVAAAFQAQGLAKGDKVGLVMKNRPEYLFTWFGLSKLGAVEVPINTAHRGEPVDLHDGQIGLPLPGGRNRVPGSGRPGFEKSAQTGKGAGAGRGRTGTAPPWTNRPWTIAGPWTTTAGTNRWRCSGPILLSSCSPRAPPDRPRVRSCPRITPCTWGEVCWEAAGYTPGRLPLQCAAPVSRQRPAFVHHARFDERGPAWFLAEKFSASRFWNEIKKYGCTEFNYIGGILPILFKRGGGIPSRTTRTTP